LDIVIEGIITKEEGMNEVIDTIIHLKSVPNALLRVSCKEEGVQGRIGFGPGGHILGGYIEDTGEVGYSAVKKLLTVKSGNYAVLDMTHEHVPEINQTLWIKGEKVLEIWPNLPDLPDSLLGASLSSIPALQSITHNNLEKKEDSIARIRQKYTRSKAHEAQITQWHLALRLSWLLITLVLVLVVVKYGYMLLIPFLTARHFITP
jgi:hypothetical protein